MAVDLKTEGINVFNLTLEVQNPLGFVFRPKEHLKPEEVQEITDWLTITESYSARFFDSLSLAQTLLMMPFLRENGSLPLAKKNEERLTNACNDFRLDGQFPPYLPELKIIFPEAAKAFIKKMLPQEFNNRKSSMFSTDGSLEESTAIAAMYKAAFPEWFEGFNRTATASKVPGESTYDTLKNAANLRIIYEDNLSLEGIGTQDMYKLYTQMGNFTPYEKINAAFALTVLSADRLDFSTGVMKIILPEKVGDNQVPNMPHEKSF